MAVDRQIAGRAHVDQARPAGRIGAAERGQPEDHPRRSHDSFLCAFLCSAAGAADRRREPAAGTAAGRQREAEGRTERPSSGFAPRRAVRGARRAHGATGADAAGRADRARPVRRRCRRMPSGSCARRRSRPSPSMSTPPPIRSSAPRSIATSCRSRPRCAPRSWSTISPTPTRRRRRPAEPFRTTVAVFPSPWTEGRKLVHIGIKGYARAGGDAPARQPRLPDRHLRLDECAEPAAAGQAVAGDAAGAARAERPRRDRHLCRQRRHRARADRGVREGEDSRRDRAPRSRRQHGRRRRHPPGLCAGRAEFRRRTASTG